jgi:hypothetical protein
MTFGKIARIAFPISVAVLLSALMEGSGGRPVAAAQLHSEGADSHCTPVGGITMTNFGAVDQNTTMGTATRDL